MKAPPQNLRRHIQGTAKPRVCADPEAAGIPKKASSPEVEASSVEAGSIPTKVPPGVGFQICTADRQRL